MIMGDTRSLERLKETIKFIRLKAPQESYGSPEAVSAWCGGRCGV